jgi:aspartate/glutamate racemase
MIGVLGGMGPAATLDFLAELVRLTTVQRDQDHVPVVVLSDPRISDRVAPVVEGRGLAARAACLDAPKPWPAPARVAPGARSGDG